LREKYCWLADLGWQQANRLDEDGDGAKDNEPMTGVDDA